MVQWLVPLLDTSTPGASTSETSTPGASTSKTSTPGASTSETSTPSDGSIATGHRLLYSAWTMRSHSLTDSPTLTHSNSPTHSLTHPQICGGGSRPPRHELIHRHRPPVTPAQVTLPSPSASPSASPPASPPASSSASPHSHPSLTNSVGQWHAWDLRQRDVVLRWLLDSLRAADRAGVTTTTTKY